MNSKLEAYIPIVEFLGKSLGNNYEISLHDIANPDHSVIAIANGALTSRAAGAPANDYTLRMMKQGEDSKKNYVVNYSIRNVNGNLVRTAGYYIRNEKGKLLGILCINFNLTNFIAIRDQLTKHIICDDVASQNEMSGDAAAGNAQSAFDNFQGSIEEVIKVMIDNSLSRYSIAPDRLSPDERMAVVDDLNEGGLFLLKGGLAALAARLNVSEPTVYRYLNKVKRTTR